MLGPACWPWGEDEVWGNSRVSLVRAGELPVRVASWRSLSRGDCWPGERAASATVLVWLARFVALICKFARVSFVRAWIWPVLVALWELAAVPFSW